LSICGICLELILIFNKEIISLFYIRSYSGVIIEVNKDSLAVYGEDKVVIVGSGDDTNIKYRVGQEILVYYDGKRGKGYFDYDNRLSSNHVKKRKNRCGQKRILENIIVIVKGGKICLKYIQIISLLGDQPKAIEYLSKGVNEGKKFQTLLGVTGSRKNLHNGKHNRKSAKTSTNTSAQQNTSRAALFRIQRIFP